MQAKASDALPAFGEDASGEEPAFGLLYVQSFPAWFFWKQQYLVVGYLVFYLAYSYIYFIGNP